MAVGTIGGRVDTIAGDDPPAKGVGVVEGVGGPVGERGVSAVGVHGEVVTQPARTVIFFCFSFCFFWVCVPTVL